MRARGDGMRRGAAELLALLASLCCAASCSLPDDRPNVLLVIIDTLRADRLGSYGYPVDVSPELDALAAQGVRFDRVIAPCTWTRPSIGAMLTGLYPRTLGLYDEREEKLDDEFATLAEVFREGGYWTVGATANPNLNAYYNFHQGFDEYYESDVVFPFMPGATEQSKSGERLALPSAERIIETIESRIRQRPPAPYYAQINLMEVHEYLRGPEPQGEAYTQLSGAEPWPENDRYLKAIRNLSLQVGGLVERLSREDPGRDTLFVVTSDHGETLLDEQPSLPTPKWHGFLVYETQARVPLILYSSAGRLPAGRTIARPVRLLDLMPTLLDYAGLPVPEGIRGVSLLPLVENPKADIALPENFFVETEFRKADKRALYAAEWIYIRNRDGQEGTDPSELQRVGEPADGRNSDRSVSNAAIAERYARLLDEWDRNTPRRPPSLADRAASEEMREQLRAIGYTDD